MTTPNSIIIASVIWSVVWLIANFLAVWQRFAERRLDWKLRREQVEWETSHSWQDAFPRAKAVESSTPKEPKA